MGILYSGATDIGKVRKSNQDSICLHPKENFFCVADGMGGHNGGDIASAMSVDIFPRLVDQFIDDNIKAQLANSIRVVNNRIYAHAQKNNHLKGMGTTITCLKFFGQHVFIGNVGDSRAYMVNNKLLYQVTKDHSLVQEKLNLGIYDRAAAAADPQKNVLIRTVGFEKDIDADVYQHKVNKNDIYLLCSDGLHGKVNDQDIIYTVNKFIPRPEIASQSDLDSCVRSLIQLANDNGGHDNISVIIVLAQ